MERPGPSWSRAFFVSYSVEPVVDPLPDDIGFRFSIGLGAAVEYLTEAYGSSLLHIDGERLFIDDPHHRPTDPRHTHERTIHVESSITDAHGAE